MDVVAPVIDPQSLSPADYGNTIHSAQPLAARITDAGSGVDAGSIVFTLFDHTAGTSSTHTAVSYADGWAKTAAISLTVGRVYRIGVEAEDVAGNLAYWEQQAGDLQGGFLATTAAAQNTVASVPDTPCVMGAVQFNTGTKRLVHCNNIPVFFEATTITVSGNRHTYDQTAFVEQEVALDDAVLYTVVDGLGTSVKPFVGKKAVASMPYVVPAAFSDSQTISVPETTVRINLTTTVDATWQSATMAMEDTGTTSSLATCADPTSDASPPSCLPDPVAHQYIVLIEDDVDANLTSSDHAAKYGARVDKVWDDALNGYAGAIPRPAISALDGDSRVKYVARNVEVVATDVESNPSVGDECLATSFDPETEQCWPTGVRRAKATDKLNRAQGIGIAVIDTGIDSSHPDLALNVRAAENCTGDGTQSGDDISGHGTGVAAVAAAIDNAVGVVGVAPSASIWSIRVFYEMINADTTLRAFTFAHLVCALDYVHQRAPSSSASEPIYVANMSLGAPMFNQGGCADIGNHHDPVHSAVCRVIGAGTTVVASAGNGDEFTRFVPQAPRPDVSFYIPAGYDDVVTATGLSDTDGGPCQRGQGEDDDFVARYQWGTALDQPHLVGAPATGIFTASSEGDYGLQSGTSFAAPIVSGVAALYIRKALDLNLSTAPEDVLFALRSDGESVDVNFREECDGAGPDRSHTDSTDRHPEPVVRADDL